MRPLGVSWVAVRVSGSTFGSAGAALPLGAVKLRKSVGSSTADTAAIPLE